MLAKQERCSSNTGSPSRLRAELAKQRTAHNVERARAVHVKHVQSSSQETAVLAKNCKCSTCPAGAVLATLARCSSRALAVPAKQG